MRKKKLAAPISHRGDHQRGQTEKEKNDEQNEEVASVAVISIFLFGKSHDSI
jgi:hypothetical protein